MRFHSSIIAITLALNIPTLKNRNYFTHHRKQLMKLALTQGCRRKGLGRTQSIWTTPPSNRARTFCMRFSWFKADSMPSLRLQK